MGDLMGIVQVAVLSFQPKSECIRTRECSPTEKVESVRNSYLELFGKVLPKGAIIIKKPQKNAPSEGIGFAGLIFSASNNKGSQDSYWKIYQGRKAYFLKPSGVMAWLVDQNGKRVITDSASDADQDWIAGEIIVLGKIKSREWTLSSGAVKSIDAFKAEIKKDLNAFWRNHVKEVNGRLIFLATDAGWAKRGDGKEIYYPSYPDPHFLRMFGEFDKGHNWKKLAGDVQDLNLEVLKNYKTLGAVGQNPIPAKVFVSVGGKGRYKVENYYEISKKEGVGRDALKDKELDSIRFVALRMPRAAVLDKDEVASKILEEIIKIAKITGPFSAHILAGSSGAPSKLGFNNTLARTGYGAALFAINSKSADDFIRSVMFDFRGKFFGEWMGAKDYYYDQSIMLQCLDLIFGSEKRGSPK